jgi:hypothetical protein
MGRIQPKNRRPEKKVELRVTPIPEAVQRAVWGVLGWEPHELQKRVLLDPTRNVVTSAGRRVGKSQMGGYKLICEVFRTMGEVERLKRFHSRREFWIVGPEYSDSEKEFRVVWDGLKELGFDFDSPGSYNNPDSGSMNISLFGGRMKIAAMSAKYPNTLVGEGLSGVVMAEAAKLKPSVWLKFIRPTLADFRGWAFFGSTPEGRNWFYDLWRIGQDPMRSDWSSYRAPSWANPHVYPGGVDEALLDRFIEARSSGGTSAMLDLLDRVETVDYCPIGIDQEIWSMLLDMSQVSFNQEIAGLFTDFVGRVFKDFDEELHVTDQAFIHGWHTFACVDYGFTNPFVWLLVQVDPHGERIHILNEYYETGRTTGEAAEEIRDRGLAPDSCQGFYPDPAEPDRTRELADKLSIRHINPGAVTIAGRVEWMRRFLKAPTGITRGRLLRASSAPIPKLTINRRCINTIREFGDYRYPETAERAAEKNRSAPENPMKKDDHTIEAFGRLVSGRFGSPWRRATKTGKVRMGR